MLDKPPIGAPCNGCGLCCIMKVCSGGVVVLGLGKWGEPVRGPCPALTEDGEKLVCGIVRRPERYVRPGRGPKALGNAMSLLLGIGHGCDTLGNEEPEIGMAALEALDARNAQRTSEKDIAQAIRIVCGR